MSPLSPNCSRLRSHNQKTSSTRLKLSRIALKSHTMPPIVSLHHTFNPNQSELPQNRSNSPWIVRISSKTSTDCSQPPCLVTNSSPYVLKSSSNPTKCLQSSQNVPKSSRFDANHRRMSLTHQKIALLLICDITECLNPHSHVPKSTPIITKWSQIIKNAPLYSVATPKICRHSLSKISQHILISLSHFQLLWINANSSQLITTRRKSSRIASSSSRNASTRRKEIPIALPSCL